MQVFSCEVSMMIETEERNIETRKEQVHIYKILDFITRLSQTSPRIRIQTIMGHLLEIEKLPFASADALVEQTFRRKNYHNDTFRCISMLHINAKRSRRI